MLTRIHFLKKRLSLALFMSMALVAAQLLFLLNSASASGNLAIGRYAWASMGYAPNAVDGVQGTIWQPGGGGPGWIIVDLGSVQDVNRIVLKTATGGYIVQSASISTSPDNITYSPQTSATYAWISSNGYTVTINLPSTVSTRYVRVDVSPVSTATMIGELEVYGP